jgi:uncharacterized membrane protein YbhN (UPF0104 family)
VRLSQAVVATLAYRIASYWLPLVAGGVSILIYRHRFGALDMSEKDAPPAHVQSRTTQ